MAHQVNRLYDVCLDDIVSRQVSSYEEGPRKKYLLHCGVKAASVCTASRDTS